MANDDYTAAELMTVVIARELKNGEWAASGAKSQIPAAAYKLAKLMHAPDLVAMIGGSGAINTDYPLVESSGDFRLTKRAEFVMTLEDIVDWEYGGYRRMPTLACFGGIQVDKHGNVNMLGIGPYEQMAVRGPGTVGLIFSTSFTKVFIFVQHHTPQIFVEQVDYVCAPGQTEDRKKYVRPHSLGPQLTITPICVFGFREDNGEMYLKSVHPGHTVNEVIGCTGFKLEVTGDVPETVPPTEEELTLLRCKVDPSGVLRRIECG